MRDQSKFTGYLGLKKVFSSFFVRKNSSPLFFWKKSSPLFSEKSLRPFFCGKSLRPFFCGKSLRPFFSGKNLLPLLFYFFQKQLYAVFAPPPVDGPGPDTHKFWPVPKSFLISEIFGNFHVQFEEKLLRDRSKFMGYPGRGHRQGGEDFFFEKIRGAVTYLQKMLGGGKRFFSRIKETGDKDFFSRKNRWWRLFSTVFWTIKISFKKRHFWSQNVCYVGSSDLCSLAYDTYNRYINWFS